MNESNRNLFFRKEKVCSELMYIIESFDEKGNSINLGEIAQFQVDGKIKWSVWFYLTHSLLAPWMLRAIGEKIDFLNKDGDKKKAEIKNQKRIRANERARLSKEAKERNRRK